MAKQNADICLILEGTYPFVRGGVSAWTHDLIEGLPDLTFALVCIQPRDAELQPVYHVPDNVIDLRVVRLQELKRGTAPTEQTSQLFNALKPLLMQMETGKGDLACLEQMLDLLNNAGNPGMEVLLNSEAAWQTLEEMYNETQPESSFIDYFWSWRALLGGMLSVLLADLPLARCYHTLSTGFAGLLGARACIEKQRPLLLTEHGIYTNERRIEINSADWLLDVSPTSFSIDEAHRDLRSLWMDTFGSYAKICYQASRRIITLYEGNQQAQIDGGAPVNKLDVIPNGIRLERFADLQLKADTHPTIALVGRVVPIKDIKTFIRSTALAARRVPHLQAYVMGPTDEDPEYYEECVALVHQLGLDDTLTFTGQVDVTEYFPHIDAIVLTSISEAQPLVILEAGAAGIPAIATDVGACRELIEGRSDETPRLGSSGIVTPLANPSETAKAIEKLMIDKEFYHNASESARKRVHHFYTRDAQMLSYEGLYINTMEQ